MTITFACAQCRKSYSVDASLAGRRVKCKACGTAIEIPAAPAPAASSPSRKKKAAVVEDVDDPYGLHDAAAAEVEAPGGGERLLPRGGGGGGGRGGRGSSSSGVPTWVWFAAGGAGLVVIGLVVALLIPRRSAPQNLAHAPTNETPEAIASAGTDSAAPVTPDPGFQKDEATAAGNESTWHVKPDPLAEPLEFPAIAKMAIPISNAYASDYMKFPSTPSPFVILGDNSGDDQYREVWDLRTVKRVGRLNGKIETSQLMALSPDGKYFAVHTNPVPRTTDIWRVADAKRIARIQDTDKIPDVLDFAGPGEGRVIIGATYSKELQVWDFLQGKKLVKVETPASFQRESITFSPNRRYLALLLSSKDRVQVYDLNNGELAGEIELESQGNAHYDCEGLAFSPDGTALAGLFRVLYKSFLKCWDVKTGKLTADFPAEKDDHYGKSQAHNSQAIQWLPDQSGWFLHDQTLVERTSGQIVWTLPFDSKNFQERSPRKLLDLGRVVTMSFNDGRRTVRLASIPKAKIQAALSLASGGGSALDATLPPITASDLNAAKAVAPPEGPIAWTAVPASASEAGASSKASGGNSKSIALKVAAGDVLNVLVSGPGDPPQALVVSSPGGRLAADKGKPSTNPRQVDRLDLASGRPLGRFEIPSVSSPIAFSPGASHVLLAHAGAADRIDLHAADGGKHVVGWRPYDKESGDDRQVAWADFLDAKRVLTVNPAGTLVLWSVPDARAVYISERAMKGVPILSPDRKRLACLRGETLRLIDPETGAAVGDSALSSHQGKDGLKVASFDPTGQELAAQLDGTLVRWDLRTGQVVTEVPSPLPDAGVVRFGDARHLLIDGKILFDLERGRAVWYYEGGVHARGGSGALDRFVASPSIIGQGTLTTIEVPEKKVVRAEAVAADPKTRAIFREGTTLSIQVVGSPVRDAEGFRDAIVKGLTEKLKAVGVEVDDDQPVKLIATFREKGTGRNIEYRKIGKNAETRLIEARQLDWELSATDGKGNPVQIATETVGFRTPGFIEHLPPGENDWEGYLRTRQWFRGAAEMVSHGVPFFVARGANGGAILPGWSFLGHPLL